MMGGMGDHYEATTPQWATSQNSVSAGQPGQDPFVWHQAPVSAALPSLDNTTKRHSPWAQFAATCMCVIDPVPCRAGVTSTCPSPFPMARPHAIHAHVCARTRHVTFFPKGEREAAATCSSSSVTTARTCNRGSWFHLHRYFGAELIKAREAKGVDADVPVGLIQSAIGGSQIESWMDNETLTVCKNESLSGGAVPQVRPGASIAWCPFPPQPHSTPPSASKGN